MADDVATLMQDLSPRLLLAAVILNDAHMLDEKRLMLLKKAAEIGDPVQHARHWVKLNAALQRP